MMARQKAWAKLTKKYAPLFTGADPRHPYPMFGIECGTGWYDILEKLCAKITKELNGLSTEERGQCYVLQVKEKFGTLRFYMAGETDAMSTAIREAEQETAKTCELCGKPGKIRNDGWVTVRCDACRRADRAKHG